MLDGIHQTANMFKRIPVSRTRLEYNNSVIYSNLVELELLVILRQLIVLTLMIPFLLVLTKFGLQDIL